MKTMIFGLLATIMATICAAPAFAEGGCPPGQLPAASNGSIQSCTPIPQEGPLVGSEPARWHIRYGALAFDPASGAVVGVKMKRSADDAVDAATRDCARTTGGTCKSLGSFSNGCIVAMRPAHLKVEPMVGYGSSTRAAQAEPARFCADSRFTCETVYSGCSKASWF
jgi:hypothetical protein